MATEKTITLSDKDVPKVSALPDGCSVLLVDSAGEVLNKMTADDFMAKLRDSIQIGGRNLLKGTMQLMNIEANTQGSLSYRIPTTLDIKGPYTLSFDANWTGDELKGKIEIYLGESLGCPVSNRNSISIHTLIKGRNHFYFSLLHKAHKVFAVWTDGTNTESLVISNVKLERGNMATDWTPAPEDIIGGGNLQSFKELQSFQGSILPRSAQKKKHHRRKASFIYSLN